MVRTQSAIVWDSPILDSVENSSGMVPGLLNFAELVYSSASQ